MGKEKRKNLNNTLVVWLIVAIFLLGSFIIKTTRANSNGIDLIYPNQPNPLFMETSNKPGDTVTKQITIRNNYSDNQLLGISASNLSGFNNLASVLNLEIANSSLDFKKTLSEINNNELAIGEITPGDTAFNIILQFNESANNDYQNKSLSFDLNFGFIDQGQSQPATTNPLSQNLPGLIHRFTSRFVATPAPTEEVTPPAETPPSEGQIKGDETQTAASSKFHLSWWQWLLAILVAFSIFFLLFWRRRREEEDSEKEIKI